MTTTTAVTEAATPRVCACNCGAAVAKKSRFRMGHDQRLVSDLAGQLVYGEDMPEGLVDLLGLGDWDPKADIEDRINIVVHRVAQEFSAGLANKVDSAARRRWEKAGKGKPAKVAEPVRDTPAEVASGDKVAALGECGGTTKAGKKCKRRAEIGTEFCHAHRKAAK
ncbi:hypothetical protein BLA60_25880 [Actinophytocola xinjiangensis]|uniref:Uncharacterized protein n=1 Tax=Actinophytocola xinjiangensis TaxID=485602 RepID=A0A7Z1AXI7_9PSEU|nr:hypothetical protein [Actinophytocola xinjiangensis]OLF07762.1 hypothetical protein BLA60_25880 [Actinophytocola xinjiangensis]